MFRRPAAVSEQVNRTPLGSDKPVGGGASYDVLDQPASSSTLSLSRTRRQISARDIRLIDALCGLLHPFGCPIAFLREKSDPGRIALRTRRVGPPSRCAP